MTDSVRINISSPTIPRAIAPISIARASIRSRANECLCPGCYYKHDAGSELCLRCTLDGCDHENTRHA